MLMQDTTLKHILEFLVFSICPRSLSIKMNMLVRL